MPGYLPPDAVEEEVRRVHSGRGVADTAARLPGPALLRLPVHPGGGQSAVASSYQVRRCQVCGPRYRHWVANVWIFIITLHAVHTPYLQVTCSSNLYSPAFWFDLRTTFLLIN